MMGKFLAPSLVLNQVNKVWKWSISGLQPFPWDSKKKNMTAVLV